MAASFGTDPARSLWEHLDDIPDRRGRKGRPYGLPAVLTLALAAMLSGANDLMAVFHWGRRLPSSPQAVAALRNAMLHVVKHVSGPLAETRAIFAGNRHTAIRAAQRGFL